MPLKHHSEASESTKQSVAATECEPNYTQDGSWAAYHSASSARGRCRRDRGGTRKWIAVVELRLRSLIKLFWDGAAAWKMSETRCWSLIELPASTKGQRRAFLLLVVLLIKLTGRDDILRCCVGFNSSKGNARGNVRRVTFDPIDCDKH